MAIKKKVWHKVVAPKPWRPKAGEEIEGYYVGAETRTGQFGEYKVYMIRTRGKDIKYLSGTIINDLFSVVPPETKVKIKFLGMKKSKTTDRSFKEFEVYTEEEIAFRIAN